VQIYIYERRIRVVGGGIGKYKLFTFLFLNFFFFYVKILIIHNKQQNNYKNITLYMRRNKKKKTTTKKREIIIPRSKSIKFQLEKKRNNKINENLIFCFVLVLFKITLNKNKIYNNLNKFLNVKIRERERESK